ncbi:MAG: hypothetical protein RBS39_13130, partial [Phycisphaerales bacterium]|nr:hypothetical protein [Phycisphaerales bacterium]
MRDRHAHVSQPHRVSIVASTPIARASVSALAAFDRTIASAARMRAAGGEPVATEASSHASGI